MITRSDLESAIAECQGKPNPDAKTCMMLSAFYIIKREMFGDDEKIEHSSYSYAPAPDQNIIDIDSGSEFARAVNGRKVSEILPIIDEMMDTLSIITPRMYNAVMSKLA